MVVRASSEPKELFMLEAFDEKGVQVSRFSTRKSFIGTHFKRMALRKLIWSEKSSKIETLKTMCKDIESLGLSSLFSGKNSSEHRYASTRFMHYVYSTVGAIVDSEDEAAKLVHTPASF